MAYVRKRDKNWQAIVRRKGFKTQIRTFLKKSQASAWARQMEEDMDMAQCPDDLEILTTTTFKDLLERYLDTKTPLKKGVQQETSRINILMKHPICTLTLDRLTSGVFARYRDERLQSVGPQKVLHELNMFGVILRTAKMDWDIPLPKVPVDDVRKPKMPPPRTRRLQDGELECIRDAALNGLSPFIWAVIEFAIETAMRRGEITSLTWQHVDFKRRVAHLPTTKNGDPRDVPLSPRAVAVLKQQRNDKLPTPFPYGRGAITHAWLKVMRVTGIQNLRFHDLRHEGVSRLFEKGLTIPEVALVSGHRDFRMLARYTHLRADDVMKKL